MSEAFVDSPLARAIGFALIQFLWQGAAIWVVTALLLSTLRRASPQLRHAVACLGLAAMVLATVSTAIGYLRAPELAAGAAASTGPAGVSNLPASLGSLPPAQTAAVPRPVFSREWLEPRLPFVMLLWASGVLVLTTHLFRGWWRVRRLRRTATAITEHRVIALLHGMGDRLGVTRHLRLLESAFIEVPAVVGWLRPAIVVPASVLTGLPPAHFEAILAHELAHVRRADYLINLVQCVVEILLFYHPAVWWVSKRIRIEREHCCDDVAASLSDRLEYARALASLEELRQAPALAMGAGGGELLGRIRRLVDPGVSAAPSHSGWLVMTLSLTVVYIAVTGAGQISRGSADATSLGPSVTMAGASLSVVPSAPESDALRNETSVPGPRPPATPREQQVRDPVVRQTAPVSGGGITGTVVDQQGGVIPGATVSIVRANRPEAEARVTITNTRGEFAFGDFVAGAYDLTVGIAGFKSSRMQVQLGPGINVNGTVRLQMGSLSESITVAGELAPGAARQTTGQAPSNPVTAADYFDVAKMHYVQRRYAEAQAATERALELLRGLSPARDQFEMHPPAVPSAAASGIAAPVRVGGDIKEPKKITDVKPAYPAEALAAGVQGVVIIDAVIGRDGFVKDARVLRSIAMLDQAALDAVRQWRFTPTLLNNVPVEVAMTVTVNFSSR